MDPANSQAPASPVASAGPRMKRPLAANQETRPLTAFPSMSALLLPVGLILGAGLVVLAALVAYFVNAQDRQAVEASKAITEASLEVESREIAYNLDSYAWWDEAVSQVEGKLDPKWLDDNFGSYQAKSHAVAASFVLDPEDKTIVGFMDGHPSGIDALRTLSGGLATLVKRTRQSSLAEPVAATGFLTLEARPMLVGAEAITPELGSPLWPASKPRYVLIFAIPMDRARLDRVAERAHIKGLQVAAPTTSSGGAVLPLVSPDGIAIGTLNWIPDLPARAMVAAIAPLGGATFVVMTLLFLSFLYRVRHVGNLLMQQAVVIDEIHDAIVMTDPAGVIARWSAGAERMLGYKGSEILGKQFPVLCPERDRGSFAEKLQELIRLGEHLELEVPLEGKDGRAIPTHVSLTPIRDKAGWVSSIVGYALDITRQKQLEARLEQLATVDELTGAYNRRYLQVHGPTELQRARRFRRPLALLMLDLDHFKRINDRYGHQFGDLVLATVSELCRKKLRPSDIFVRYGGEEFVALLPETGMNEGIATARRLSDQIRGTVFSLAPRIEGLTVSIGVAVLDASDEDIASVVNRADRAMYRAKELGRDRVEFLGELST